MYIKAYKDVQPLIYHYLGDCCCQCSCQMFFCLLNFPNMLKMYLREGLVLGLLLWCLVPDAASTCSEATITAACMACICSQESDCNANQGCNPDGGTDSCGPYQIKEIYWIDGGRQGSSWRTCAQDMSCAERTIRAYMTRYATCSRLNHTPTCEDWARIHNGGPNGWSKSSTVGYWSDIQEAGCS